MGTSNGRRISILAAQALLAALLLVLVVTALLVAPLRWLNPATSAFMLAYRVHAPDATLRHDWVGMDAIAPAMPLAVIAAEDQKFAEHTGFDFASIAEAMSETRTRTRGASTISQQLSKNLWLWGGRSFLRKGLEAWMTLALELLVPKRRILEIYLNVAEFGPGIYGVASASREYFDKPAAALTSTEAAQLAAVLPSPRRYSLRPPSPYVRERSVWILEQMQALGPGYLLSLR